MTDGMCRMMGGMMCGPWALFWALAVIVLLVVLCCVVVALVVRRRGGPPPGPTAGG